MTKVELRNKYRNIRHNLDESYRVKASKKITRRVLSKVKKYSVVASFISMDNEPFTNDLNRKMMNKGIKIIIPHIDDPDNILVDHNVECAIIPGIAFDQKNHRVGFGKGCYDRWLTNLKAKKIMIAFKEQESSTCIPIEDTDIIMDLIITN